MRFNLRTKFILLSTLVVTVIMINVTYFFTIRELKDRRESAETQIQRIAENIATMQLLDQQDWNVYQNYISQLMIFNKDIIYIAIYDDRNSLRAYTLNGDMIELERSVQTRWERAEIVKQLDQGSIDENSRRDIATRKVNIQLGDRILGSVHVGFSLIKINVELQKRIRLNIGLSVIFLILFAIVSTIISRRLTGPLERLSSAMNEVSAGNFQPKINIKTRDEIGKLSENFNQMVEGLREREEIEKLGNELSSTFIKSELAQLVRERIKNAIGASSGRLYIKNREYNGCFQEITVPKEQRADYPDLELNERTRTYLKKHPNGFMVHNAPEEIQKMLKHTSSREAGLVIPMTVKNQLFGMLFFGLTDNTPSFNLQKQYFAAALASQAAIALENSLLYEDLKEKERFRRELEIAKEVQKRLLPREMPQLEGFQLDAICIPAFEVGGDYYDFFQLDENSYGIAIADVSGKGTYASFYMAEIKGMMTQLTTPDLSPKQLLTEINRSLYNSVDRHIFITMIYGILNISERRFTFSRAGHNSLVHISSDGSYKILTPSGIGLGLEKGELFIRKIEEIVLKIDPGETLILYTDGVTEAMNSKQEEFGEKKLIQLLHKHHKMGVKEIRKIIVNEISKFMSSQEQHDDLTMVLLKRDI